MSSVGAGKAGATSCPLAPPRIAGRGEGGCEFSPVSSKIRAMMTLRPLVVTSLILGGMVACVPSPTATPPSRTAFPTLPLPTDELTPLATPTFRANAPTRSPLTTRLPQATHAPGNPSPVPATATLNPLITPPADTMPPLLQMTVQEPQLPISVDQPVGVALVGADNKGIAHLDLYDNNVLYAQLAAPLPAPLTFSNIFTWKASAAGRHTLRGVAFDTSGNSSEAAQVDLTVINNNRAPNVLITSPASSKDLELGAPIVIQGVATDDVAVTQIELVVDNQPITHVTPDKPGGVTPFAVAIPWTPTTTGVHNILLRAHDNQGDTDDSLRITARVFSNQAPAVTARLEHDTIPAGDVLLVNALALAQRGVARVELYVDDQLADTVRSSDPPAQTTLDTQLVWSDDTAGDHSVFVRAYDVGGQTTDSARTTVHVREGGSRIVRETLAPPARTPLPPAPTATPQQVLPAPPTVQIATADGRDSSYLPGPLKLRVTAHGSVELGNIEVWAEYPGQAPPELVTSESGQGSIDKTFEVDWMPPQSGVVEIRAAVYDNVGQVQRSDPLRVYLLAPPAPAATPAVFNFAQRWVAASPASPYEINFDQIGRGLRGTLIETRAGGPVLPGVIVTGSADPNRVVFGVDFSGSAAPRHTLEFDCSFTPNPPTLRCNYQDENGSRGSAVFGLAQK